MMETNIPEIVYFASQPFDWQGRLHLACTAGLGFDLLSGDLLPPDRAFAAAMESLGDDATLDGGVPKKTAEWLLAGRACVRSGETASRLVLDITVGAKRRRFLVQAEKPFETFPLLWKATFGTAEENPSGLPVTQVTRAPLTDASAPFGTPACPLSRGPWPCRMRHMGSCDASWLGKSWPGLPHDTDMAFFNLAQPAQFLPEGISGSEAYSMTNLHPDHPLIEGALPGRSLTLRVEKGGEIRQYALRADTIWFFPNHLAGLIFWHALVPCRDESAGDIDVLRITMEPEEVPADARAEVQAVPAKGQEKDTTDTAQETPSPRPVVPKAPATVAQPAPEPPKMPEQAERAAEGMEEPHPLSEAALSKKLDDSLPDINAGLASAGLPPLTPAQVQETKTKLAAMASRLRAAETKMAGPVPEYTETLRSAGASPDEIVRVGAALDLPMPDPAAFVSPKLWEEAVDKYIGKFSSFLHASEGMQASMRSLLLLRGPGGDMAGMTGGIQDPKQAFTRAGMKPDKAAALLDLLNGDIPSDPAGMKAFAQNLEQKCGFPAGSVTGRIAALETQLASLGFRWPEPEKAKTPEKTPEPEKTESRKTESVRPDPANAAGVGPLHPAPPVDREGVLAWLASGRSLAGCRLVGLDLSGLDLTACDLTGADLAGANLAGTILAGASLAGASLEGADMTEADLTAAKMAGASLVRARAERASFQRCDMTEADLGCAEAGDADFTEAVLTKARLCEGNFRGAMFQNVRAAECAMQGASLVQARIRYCDMKGATFAGADCTAADVHGSNLDGADFTGAVLDRASFCYGTTVLGGLFAGASLADGAWTQVRGRGARFSGCRARNTQFCDSDFTASVWAGSVLKECDFSRSSLSGADMEGVDLFTGSLREAELSAANFRDASLYGVDMTRMRTDPATIFDGADCTATIRGVRERMS